MCCEEVGGFRRPDDIYLLDVSFPDLYQATHEKTNVGESRNVAILHIVSRCNQKPVFYMMEHTRTSEDKKQWNGRDKRGSQLETPSNVSGRVHGQIRAEAPALNCE